MVTIIIVAVVVLAVLVIAALAWRKQRRTSELQDRFGPEYDRVVSEDDKKSGERELAERAERRDELEIRDLAPQEATRFREEWFGIQQRFVDAPGEAVTAARALLTSAMRERGYPTDSKDERESMLSVDHTEVVDRYREASAIEDRGRSSGVTTEDLRQAMKHYGAVFDKVVGGPTPVIDITDDDYPDEAPQPASTTRRRSSVSARRGSPADPDE